MQTKLFFRRSVERLRKKGHGHGHYEAFTRAFTRAFTSGRLEIIRPLTSHNSKIMRVFVVYDPLLCLFSVCFCFYCCHCQRGLRKLPEFLSSYVRSGHFFLRENHRVIQDDFHSFSLLESFLRRVFHRIFLPGNVRSKQGAAFLLSLSRKGD